MPTALHTNGPLHYLQENKIPIKMGKATSATALQPVSQHSAKTGVAGFCVGGVCSGQKMEPSEASSLLRLFFHITVLKNNLNLRKALFVNGPQTKLALDPSEPLMKAGKQSITLMLQFQLLWS